MSYSVALWAFSMSSGGVGRHVLTFLRPQHMLYLAQVHPELRQLVLSVQHGAGSACDVLLGLSRDSERMRALLNAYGLPWSFWRPLLAGPPAMRWVYYGAREHVDRALASGVITSDDADEVWHDVHAGE